MRKRIFSTILAVLTAASALMFSACGKTEWVVDDTTGLTHLEIGGIGPLSGAYADYGNAVMNGAKLAVEEINAAGGVNGFQFVLDFQDSQGDPTSAKNAYGKLIDDGMKVSLGGVLSGETATVVAEAREDGILVLTPSASAKASIEGSDNAFRICFNDPGQGTLAAKYIAMYGLGEKIALFYDSGTDYSTGIVENFRAACAENGLTIVGDPQTFTESTSTDFSAQINAIEASGADLIFMPIYAPEASAFLTQARGSGKLTGVTVFGCDGLDGVLQQIGEANVANAEGVFMLTPFAADDTEANVASFVAAYKAAYNAVPNQFAADGYDAVYTIKAAIEKAALSAEDTADFNSRIVAAMYSIEVDGVTGTMTWTADGETTKDAKILVVQDGVAVDYRSLVPNP